MKQAQNNFNNHKHLELKCEGKTDEKTGAEPKVKCLKQNECQRHQRQIKTYVNFKPQAQDADSFHSWKVREPSHGLQRLKDHHVNIKG